MEGEQSTYISWQTRDRKTASERNWLYISLLELVIDLLR